MRRQARNRRHDPALGYMPKRGPKAWGLLQAHIEQLPISTMGDAITARDAWLYNGQWGPDSIIRIREVVA